MERDRIKWAPWQYLRADPRFRSGAGRRVGAPEAGFGHVAPIAGWALMEPAQDEPLDVVPLRAAAMHHLVVVAMRRSSGRSGVPIKDLAAFAGRDADGWNRILNGQWTMMITDVAAAAAAGPDGLPDPSVAHASVRDAVAAAVAELRVLRQVRAGKQPSEQQERAVMKALGDVVTRIEPPLTPSEEDALRHIVRRVSELAPAAVLGLLELTGQPLAGGVPPEVDVQAALTYGQDEHIALGSLSTGSTTVSVKIAKDWTDKVDAPGWSMLDGRLVLDVDEVDRDGRPVEVLVLDAYPAHGGQPLGEDGQPRDGWGYWAAPARVAWYGATPDVTPTWQPWAD